MLISGWNQTKYAHKKYQRQKKNSWKWIRNFQKTPVAANIRDFFHSVAITVSILSCITKFCHFFFIICVYLCVDVCVCKLLCIFNVIMFWTRNFNIEFLDFAPSSNHMPLPWHLRCYCCFVISHFSCFASYAYPYEHRISSRLAD